MPCWGNDNTPHVHGLFDSEAAQPPAVRSPTHPPSSSSSGKLQSTTCCNHREITFSFATSAGHPRRTLRLKWRMMLEASLNCCFKGRLQTMNHNTKKQGDFGEELKRITIWIFLLILNLEHKRSSILDGYGQNQK
ncbi:unnamed protein product [Cuscuta campestris]|uniref:Uncharacterized protein n=1 Tax=Cuscuta campestris TaxID=132261 RepID=A0A484KBL0_9ASTE|nr:unnamed protein product [Cuscuta campestris]